MAVLTESRELFSQWIEAVVGAVDAVAGRLVRARRIRLAQHDNGTFTAKAVPAGSGAVLGDLSFRLVNGAPQPSLPAEWKVAFRGSSIEAELPASQAMTHLLDFPSQAGDFLDGMIRTQIDRLTPWSARDAVFGWTAPKEAADGRIEVVFAATSKSKIAPLLQLAQALDAASLAVYAAAPSDASARIILIEKSLRSVIGPAINLPRLLRAILLSAGIAAAASLLLNAWLGGSLQDDLGDLQRRITQRRAALRLDANGLASGLGLLSKRKQTTPSTVMVLEAVTRALPDSTFVTELRIEGDKVQVVGMTQDAPSLIRLMEQSPQFTRATFFAPTTRAANEPGERFHIEAHITPYFGSGS
jgi:general secretion pathway protein L